MKKLLIINGSLHGSTGNCERVAAHIKTNPDFIVAELVLKDALKEEVENSLQNADAFIVLSGTYWDSWGSPLQNFFEAYTYLEATKSFMGKPLGAVVLSHSTGGRGVLSRLLVNFNLFGCLIPPMAGIELSFVAQEALKYSLEESLVDDIWSLSDVNLVLKNLKISAENQVEYTAWEIDTGDFSKTWIGK